MVVTRLRQAEQRLEQPVHGRRIEQVASAHDVRDALCRVVEHHRKVIARRRFLSREDQIAPCGGIGRNDTGVAGGARTRFHPTQ